METLGPFCHLIDGEPYHLYIEPSVLRKALLFDPKEGDIIQLTFPKSGSHWVQQIIQLIIYRGESAKDLKEYARRAPVIEMQGEEMISQNPSPRLIITQLRLGRIAYRKHSKYVYVARNPWDCCASMYHFFKELPGLGKYPSLDEFVDLFLEGKTGWGDYFGHVLSGYTWRTEPNVFFMTYEELKRDTPATVLKLAHFLGAEHGKAIEEDRDFLNTVLEKSSVEYMKGIFNVSQDLVFDIFTKNANLTPTNENSPGTGDCLFVRHGKVGGWKELFGREHLRKFEDRIKEVFRDSDIMQLWNDEWTIAKRLLKE